MYDGKKPFESLSNSKLEGCFMQMVSTNSYIIREIKKDVFEWELKLILLILSFYIINKNLFAYIWGKVLVTKWLFSDHTFKFSRKTPFQLRLSNRLTGFIYYLNWMVTLGTVSLHNKEIYWVASRSVHETISSSTSV